MTTEVKEPYALTDAEIVSRLQKLLPAVRQWQRNEERKRARLIPKVAAARRAQLRAALKRSDRELVDQHLALESRPPEPRDWLGEFEDVILKLQLRDGKRARGYDLNARLQQLLTWTAGKASGRRAW